ncbi:MAG: MarR family winged helix-turn-helix transcriptional regulator [Gammaproteobacteria bacterium]
MPNQDCQIENKASNTEVNLAAALLGMNIFNETKKQMKSPLKKESLTMNQWVVLKILFLNRANTASRVSNIMNTDGASITRNLDELEYRGFIERDRQINDRRVIHLKLTIKGLQVTEKLFASYAELLNNFENRLAQNERAMWRKVEQCIATHISKTTPVTFDC